MQPDASRELEKVTRLSYGRLVAILASRAGNVQEAEDALGEAFLKALASWPQTGLPQSPEAWLLSVARRHWTDMKRHNRMAVRHDAHLAMLEDERVLHGMKMFPDERLKLMFACAHPAIEVKLRAPLILQTVLGLDVKRMASAFLVPPATLGQRLSRAKTKIALAGIPFQLPEPETLDARLMDVLTAIYAAYSVGFDGIALEDEKSAGLAQEAIWLVSLICQILPQAAETHGLFSLMLFAEARRPARIDSATRRFVPLAEQDVTLWDQRLINDAEKALRNASANLTIGRFQIEASIQAVHTARRKTGTTDWAALLLLYEGLIGVSPTAGALTSHAAALAEVHGPQAGLDALEAIDPALRSTYQPWWAVRAHLAARAGWRAEASEAFERAIGLCEDAAVRQYLMEQKLGLTSLDAKPVED